MIVDCRIKLFESVFFQRLIVVEFFLLQDLGHADPVLFQSPVIPEGPLDADSSLYLSIKLCLENPVSLLDLLLKQLSFLFDDPSLDPSLLKHLAGFLLLRNMLYQHLLVRLALPVAPPVLLNNDTGLLSFY